MATPEELRERLRAKRDAQIQQQHQRDAIHLQARQAVQDLIILGYNFPQILELSKGEVSADHLDAHYKALGYYRRKEKTPTEAPRSEPPDRFGTPRWLNSEKNYTISLEDSEPESASEDDAAVEEMSEQKLVASVPSEATNGHIPSTSSIDWQPALSESRIASPNPQANAAASPETGFAEQRMSSAVEGEVSPAGSESMQTDQQNSYANGRLTTGELNYPTENSEIPSSGNQPEVQHEEAAESEVAEDKLQDALIPTDSIRSEDTPLVTGSAREPMTQLQSEDVFTVDQNMTDQDCTLPDQNISREMMDQQMLDQQMSDQQSSGQQVSEQQVPDQQMPDQQALGRQVPGQVSQAPDQQMTDQQLSDQQISEQEAEDRPKNGSPDSQSQAGLGHLASPPQAGPEDSDMESSSEEEAPPLEDTIQEELRKVQEQIRTMQERKLAKEAQREAEVAMQRRTTELSGIAAKRAVLMQARHKLNMPRLTSRVAKLENKLKNAKETVLSAAVQLKDINAQSMELEKKEIQIRNELARPPSASSDHIAVDSHSDGPEAANEQNTSSKKEVDASEEAKAPPVKVLTAQDSPLRMFGSWRLAPLGPRHWFSPTFNGRFVKDLDIREFCNVDLNGETCVDRECQFVHYHDFEVPTNLVVEYMATRGIDRPGYKEGLIEAIRTHLPGPDAAPEQLAAAVVGFRQQYDSSQVLDWDSWAVDRPL